MIVTGASLLLTLVNIVRAALEVMPKALEIYSAPGLISHLAGTWVAFWRNLLSFNPIQAIKECSAHNARPAQLTNWLGLGPRPGQILGGIFGFFTSVIGIVGIAFAAPLAIFATIGAISGPTAALVATGLSVVDSTLPSIGAISAGSATVLGSSLGAAGITSGIGLITSGVVTLETGIVTATKALDEIEQEVIKSSTKHIVSKVGYGPQPEDEKPLLISDLSSREAPFPSKPEASSQKQLLQKPPNPRKSSK
jgi:hypothetical protein